MTPLDDCKMDEPETAEEFIEKGKRNLLCLEASGAVECFQKACQMIAKKHGDFHEELAVPNLLYGTALLELARTENQIFGETVGQSECDYSADDDTMEENAYAKDNISEIPEKESDKTDEVSSTTKTHTDNIEIQKIVDNDSLGSVKNTDEAPDEETVNENDEVDSTDVDDNEPVSTLQLAWEVVEVAKALFSKKNDYLKVADCLEKLAEISCEKEDPGQAVSDLLECLSLRVDYASDNARLIAETHFQLAVAYSLANNKTSSDVSFGQALEHLRNHKLDLEEKLHDTELRTGVETSEKSRLGSQIVEVAKLIHEVAERQRETSDPVKTEVVFEKQQPGRKRMDENIPVGDITHLIKRKRPVPEEPLAEKDTADETEPAKKTKLDSSKSDEDATTKCPS